MEYDRYKIRTEGQRRLKKRQTPSRRSERRNRQALPHPHPIDNDYSRWSAGVSPNTDAGGPDTPGLPSTATGDYIIALSWTVPADNGATIEGSWVERSREGNAPWERLTSDNATTSYSDADLYRGTMRYCRVDAFNEVGAGPFPDQVRHHHGSHGHVTLVSYAALPQRSEERPEYPGLGRSRGQWRGASDELRMADRHLRHGQP